MTELLGVIVGAAITYAIKILDDNRTNKEYTKAYKTLLILEFEENIRVLKEHDFGNNPFYAVSQKFWYSNSLQLAKHIPNDAALYRKWLIQCQSAKTGIEKMKGMNEIKKFTYQIASEGVSTLKIISSRPPQ